MGRGRVNSLRWEQPIRAGRFAEVKSALRKTLGYTEARPSSLEALLLEHGIPTAEMSTARDEAVALLEAAAEVEHSLLVQYLYATYSLDTATDVGRGRSIAQIAHQEMGHLATVQNILLALRATPYFDRQDRSPNPDDPIPFLLEGLTKAALERYIAAEMPAIDDIADADERRLAKEILERVGQSIQVRRVGALYAKIYWLFQSSDAPEGPISLPGGLFPSGVHVGDHDLTDFNLPHQSDAAEWSIASHTQIHVDRVASRSEILDALHVIMVQGEGWQAGEDTHYRRFMNFHQRYDNDPSALPVPQNPGSPTAPIDNPTARALMRLFDTRYRVALAILVHCFSRSRDDPVQLRSGYLMPWALDEMRQVLRKLGERIVTLPAAQQLSERAAPAFLLEAFSLPTTETQAIAANRALITESRTLSDQVRAAAGTAHDDILGLIAAKDAERLEVLDQL